MAILAALMPLCLALAARPASAQSGTVVASDNFDRADESPFVVGMGHNWGRVIAGNFDGHSDLIGNRVTGVTKEGIYYWQGPGTFDNSRQFARETVVQKDGEVGLVLLGGPDQAIMVSWGPPGVGSTLYIYWYSSGLDRGQLATAPSSLQNGDVIEATLDGGMITAKVNGTVVASVPDTTTLTSGRPGFITYVDINVPDKVSILDDWEAGTPPSYSIGGTISENAVGLGGVLVTASGGFDGSATTDGSGAYSITGVVPGSTGIVLTPTLSGHAMSPQTRTVAGPVTADVTGEDFTASSCNCARLDTVASHGSVTRNPDQPTYTLGTSVALTPVPDENSVFAGWSGDVPPGHELDDPLNVTMDQDRTITAAFAFTDPDVIAADGFDRADETPLVVGGNWQNVGQTGGGTVNLTSDHVAGNTGDALYYWQGAGTFDNQRQFARATVTDPSGQVGLVLLGASGQALITAWKAGTLYIYWYAQGTYQTQLLTTSSPLHNGDVIEAVLDSGTVFARINNTVVASVDDTTTLTSGRPGFETFLSGGSLDNWEAGTPASYSISGTITENAAGLGGVLVTASGGFDGSATTDASGAYSIPGVVPGSTAIILTPARSGHLMTPQTRTVAGPVTADVTGQDFTATACNCATLDTAATHGSVTRNPDQPSYTLGTVVTLTPVGDGAYAFAGWSGDVPLGHEHDHPLQVTMDQDRTILATFADPNVIATDNFDRANEAPLVVGGNWQNVGQLGDGTAHLIGDHVAGNAGDAVYYWQGPGTFDNTRQFVRATVTDPSGQVGLVLLGGSGHALITAWNAGTLYIYWYSQGIYQSQLTTTSSTLHDGDVIEAALDAGTVSAKVNGTVVASVANTTTLSSGRPGFETFLSGGMLDNWEARATRVACDDGIDNDGDGLVDMADPGCANGADTSEQNSQAACDDGIDNDGDGLIDMADPGCSSPSDPSEQNALAACDDGIDNDGDGLIDMADPG